MQTKTIGLIGCGSMGEALAAGWLQSGLVTPRQILVWDADPEKLAALIRQHKVRRARDNPDLAGRADVLFLAVKPQVVDAVLQEISGAVASRTVLVSIAAGVPIARIESAMGRKLRVVRVMPNTPALIGEGISAVCCNQQVTVRDKQHVLQLLQAVGETVEVVETMMDAVTGLSGSGPAYLFVLIEALSDAGVRQGLPRDVAARLAVWTVRGAAGLVLKTGRHPGELKDMVASPGGTTISGLHALEKGKFRAALYNAVAAATERSAALGRGE